MKKLTVLIFTAVFIVGCASTSSQASNTKTAKGQKEIFYNECNKWPENPPRDFLGAFAIEYADSNNKGYRFTKPLRNNMPLNALAYIEAINKVKEANQFLNKYKEYSDSDCHRRVKILANKYFTIAGTIYNLSDGYEASLTQYSTSKNYYFFKIDPLNSHTLSWSPRAPTEAEILNAMEKI